MAASLLGSTFKAREPVLVDVAWGYGLTAIGLASVLKAEEFQQLGVFGVISAGTLLASLLAATLFSERIFYILHWLVVRFRYTTSPFLGKCYRGVTGEDPEDKYVRAMLKGAYMSIFLAEHKARMATLLYALIANLLILFGNPLQTLLGIDIGFIGTFLVPFVAFVVLLILIVYETANSLKWKAEIIAVYELAIEKKRKADISNFDYITGLLGKGAWLEAQNWLQYELIPQSINKQAVLRAEATDTEYRLILSFDKEKMKEIGVLPNDENRIRGDRNLLKVDILGKELRIRQNDGEATNN